MQTKTISDLLKTPELSNICLTADSRHAAVYPSEASTPPPVACREPTLAEKLRFFEVCCQVCPRFTIRPDMKPLLNDIVRWCLRLDGPYDPDKGLWIWGEIGTGKSTMLEIIRRYCGEVRPPQRYRDAYNATQLNAAAWKYSFLTTNAAYITGVFARQGYPGIEDYIISRRQAFDELGRETIPAAHFGTQENVFQYILQRRYDLRHNDFTHVTSNLAPADISPVYGDHIFDRCCEMFNFVRMSGASWRA